MRDTENVASKLKHHLFEDVSLCVLHYSLLADRVGKDCLLGQSMGVWQPLQQFPYEEKSWKHASKLDRHPVHITLSRGQLSWHAKYWKINVCFMGWWAARRWLAQPLHRPPLQNSCRMQEGRPGHGQNPLWRPSINPWSTGSVQVGGPAACCNRGWGAGWEARGTPTRAACARLGGVGQGAKSNT